MWCDGIIFHNDIVVSCYDTTSHCAFRYPLTDWLMVNFPEDVNGNLTFEQNAFNSSLNYIRQMVENGFGILKAYFNAIQSRVTLRIGQTPVGEIVMVCALLVNLLNCVMPNQISQRFACHPPTMRQYLNDNEVEVM